MSRAALGRQTVIGAALGILAGACSIAGGSQPADTPHRLLVRAADYSFSAPDTVPAGFTTVRLESVGKELHHLQLLRIAEGHTFEELRDSAAHGDPRPGWATPTGGPDVPGPEGSEVIVDLRPGVYALICFMPSPKDSLPHFAKGMIRPLVVTAGGSRGREPEADVRILLNDYSFTITPAIRSGRHVLRIENAAAQPHEAVLFRLAPGKSVADVLEWAGRLVGPPPGEFRGGTTAIATGGVNLMAADFDPGEYVLLCFAPDASDHRPHVAHGMIHQFRVE